MKALSGELLCFGWAASLCPFDALLQVLGEYFLKHALRQRRHYFSIESLHSVELVGIVRECISRDLLLLKSWLELGFDKLATDRFICGCSGILGD